MRQGNCGQTDEMCIRDRDDTIPLSGTNNQYSVDPFVAGPLGIPFTSVASRWMTEGDKIVYVPASDIYVEYLKRMKQLFDEKLLDQEYFTQNEEQLRAKGAAIQLGTYSYSAHFVMTGSTDPEVYGPVSYTHLDVYKRQDWHYCQPLP